MAISCIIIEDNIKQSNANKSLLKAYFGIIDQAFSLEEAVEKLKASTYDIILADVHLGDGVVFEALNTINLKRSKLIFTTSYSDYAIEAFKHSALVYLLKPYTNEELKIEVLKVIDAIHQENYYKQIEVFFHNMQAKQQNTRIVLKNHDLIHVVELKDIYYAKADNNYTHFFCDRGKKVLVSKSLKTFEEQLSKQHFFRCHHSYLINLNKIKTLHKSADTVILNDGSTIPVASRKKKLLQALLNF